MKVVGDGMVKLIDEHGETVWISPPAVRCIRAAQLGTRHGALLEYVDGDTVRVTTPPGEVSDLFYQWFHGR